MVYLSIDGDFWKKNEKSLSEKYKSETGADDGGYIYDDDIEGKIDEIIENSLTVRVENSKIGYISVEVPLTTDDLISILEIAVKKMNIRRSCTESLK